MASTDLYKQLQKTFLKETGLGIGDRVKVLTTGSRGHLGWDVMWMPEMNEAVGETVTIEEIAPSMGLLLRWKDGSNGRAYFPFFVLEKAAEEVSEPQPELKPVKVPEPDKPKTFTFRNHLVVYRDGNELLIAGNKVTGDMLETIRRILSGEAKVMKPFAKSRFGMKYAELSSRLTDYVTEKLQAIPNSYFFDNGDPSRDVSINSFPWSSNGVLDDSKLWSCFKEMFSIEWRPEYDITKIAGYNVEVYDSDSEPYRYIKIGCKNFYFYELERFLEWVKEGQADEHASLV
jgi:hypothetical protein